MDTDQLKGKARAAQVRASISLIFSSQIDGGDCKPITSEDGKPVFPCGLIANSVFNGQYPKRNKLTSDTYPSVVLLNPSSESIPRPR